MLYNGGEFKRGIGALHNTPFRDGTYLPAKWNADLVRWHNLAITSTVVVDKKVIVDAGLFTESSVNVKERGEDWVMWKKIVTKFPNIHMGYLDKSTTVYDRACHGREEPDSELIIP